MPQALGEAPMLDNLRPAPQPPLEHQSSASSVPQTVDYEGGGIFASSTPGPAEEQLPEEAEIDRPRGYDFGPSVASPPMMSSAHAPPMAAPGMPDIGPPPTMGGSLGQVADRGTLGFTVIAAAGGAIAGYYYGGGWGALAGSLFGGATVSAFRAAKHVKEGSPESDKEAITSGTYAVGAAAIGGVIWAKLVQAETRAKPNKSKKKTAALTNPDECDIRPVGP